MGKKRSNKTKRRSKKRSKKRIHVSKKAFGINVLYCGMGNDIYNPLVLLPGLKKLYVMDLIESHKDKDKQIDVISHILEGKIPFNKHYFLPHKAFIKDTYKTSNYFYLLFDYDGIERELYYFIMDYRISPWPSIINKIDTLMCIGAPFGVDYIEIERIDLNKTYDDEFGNDLDYIKRVIINLQKMMFDRFNSKILYIPGNFWGKNDDKYFNIKKWPAPGYIDDNDKDVIEYTITNKNNVGLIVDNPDYLKL